MKKELFAELMESAGEALEHARGKRDLRTTVLPAAPAPMGADDIRTMREGLNASQAVFARCLNVSTQLVQAWEASRRRPEGAALRLLDIARRDPSAVFAALGGFETNATRSTGDCSAPARRGHSGRRTTTVASRSGHRGARGIRSHRGGT